MAVWFKVRKITRSMAERETTPVQTKQIPSTSEEQKRVDEDPITRTTRADGYENVWIWSFKVSHFQTLHTEFAAQPGDVVLASVMKCGTTWMKAILHSLMACVYSFPNLLDKYNPHHIVPGLEYSDNIWKWPHMSSPRLLSSHLPFYALPAQIIHNEEPKIVYVTRNPRDAFVSLWKFWKRVAETTAVFDIPRNFSKEAAFESFCAGRFHGGPFAENVLSYQRESRRRPNKILLVSYEELQGDCEGVICRVGEFLGYPSDVVKRNVGDIVRRCSFERLTSLDVNKGDEPIEGAKVPNSVYFRRGKSGDWREHFSPPMEQLIKVGIEDLLEQE